MKQITAAQFDSEVLNAKGPVLVAFSTEHCPPGLALAPVLQEWELESEQRIKVLNVDAGAEQALAASYGVTAVPALFLFLNGKCVGQTTGLKSKKALNQWAADALRAGALTS